MAKKTIEDIQVNGKRVLVRCDFNVPMDENKVITDENRLRGALPTIQVPDGAWRQSHPVLPPGPSQGRVQHEVFPARPSPSA